MCLTPWRDSGELSGDQEIGRPGEKEKIEVTERILLGWKLKEHDILKKYVNFARSQHHTSSLTARHVDQNKLDELFKLFRKVG